MPHRLLANMRSTLLGVSGQETRNHDPSHHWARTGDWVARSHDDFPDATLRLVDLPELDISEL
jgi:hypothetical protein